MTDQRPVWPSPQNPMAVARKYMESRTRDGVPLLRYWRGNWMEWRTTHWEEIETATVRAALYAALETAEWEDTNKDGLPERKPWQPNRHKVANAMEALHAITHLPDSVNTPAWIGERDGQPNPGEIVAYPTGLLHVTTRERLDHNPLFFNVVSVPFDYDPNATAPNWETFLAGLWPKDAENQEQSSGAIDALQEFAGYVLSGRTDLQKILLLIGPSRSGKGTIARIMQRLVGPSNTAGPTLTSLTTNFGLAALLGKPLAVISDARISGNTHQIVERLLTISGEDTITVDRKFREPWTGKLPTRFMIMSNELPSLGDASGAIAHRFVVLIMTKSWLGQENSQLTDELAEELPGILNWALDGLDRLSKNSRFTCPDSSGDAVITMLDNASPMSAFVRDHCEAGAGYEISVDELWDAWRHWCEDSERKPGTKQGFGKSLKAVAPGVSVYRPRGDDGTQQRKYLGLRLNGSWRGFAERRGSSRLTAPESAPPGSETRRDADQHKSAPTLSAVSAGVAACDRCGSAPSQIFGSHRLCQQHAPAGRWAA